MSVVSANGSAVALSPNYIINGAFDYWQRGSTLTTTSAGAYGYIADRFRTLADKTVTFSLQSFAPGAAPASSAGIEPTYFFRADISSGGSYVIIDALIEDVRTLAGQTATLSFYLKSSVAGTLDAPSIMQNFGTGGSTLTEQGGTMLTGAVSTSSSWRRYTSTISVPSIAGKTIGTGSHLAIRIRMDVSAAAKQVDIWGVQLEAGSVATPFRRNSPNLQAELAACQRYYWSPTAENNPYMAIATAYGITTTNGFATFDFPVPMRSKPTFTVDSVSNFSLGFTNTNYGLSGLVQNTDGTSTRKALVSYTAATTMANAYQVSTFYRSANFGLTGSIGFSAEF